MRVVILGTGTHVGKTYVTACLARTLRERVQVVALKPVESGVGPGESGDAGEIAAAAGHAPVLSRWRFRSAVSPHLAAREAGTRLDPHEVALWVREQEVRSGADVTLVELAGGVFTPLGPGVTNHDLSEVLQPARTVLVAPDSLGVLHDVSAVLRALPRPPDAVVLSSARAPDASTGTNARELRALGIAQVLEVVRPGASECDALAVWLLRHASDNSSYV